jgi:hypothetical protein
MSRITVLCRDPALTYAAATSEMLEPTILISTFLWRYASSSTRPRRVLLADDILLGLSVRDKENEQYQKVRYSEDINEKYKRRNARV